MERQSVESNRNGNVGKSGVSPGLATQWKGQVLLGTATERSGMVLSGTVVAWFSNAESRNGKVGSGSVMARQGEVG